MRRSARGFLQNANKFNIISNNSTFRPDYVALIQTDGSYKPSYKISRTAVLYINSENPQFSIKTYFDHRNSYESEWQSIIDGIEYAIKKDDSAIELENDNLSVITCLINKTPPKNKYIKEYYYSTLELSKHLDLFSVRWIPREENKADELFELS